LKSLPSGPDLDKKRAKRKGPSAGGRPKKDAAVPAAAALDARKSGSNLTYGQWVVVFDFVKAHPELQQDRVVEHFRAMGWKVSQSNLSKKLQQQDLVRAEMSKTATGANAKRPRIVACPAIERALVIWFRVLEARGELVTGIMLLAKRERFEATLEVPDDERVTGKGWLDSFKKAYALHVLNPAHTDKDYSYGLKEYLKHGEAASVDGTAVAAERVRLRAKVAAYRPEDIYNCDEAALFYEATPNRGLGTEQMSGKKQSKKRITLLFFCNSTGTDKDKIMFIGKYKTPVCFRSKSAKECGFYYRYNKTSWMTSELFEE